jgi:hypothetical protein
MFQACNETKPKLIWDQNEYRHTEPMQVDGSDFDPAQAGGIVANGCA